ncbi:MAG: hypothetical protein HY735_01280 [Verrucomicrobia bacterium]|nr:hypothetical protein [Verrucomicrobiota bacterium]
MSRPEEEFPKLTKLLAWKRHEKPPPAYFDRFREKLIDRIEAEELVEYSSWWRWLVEKFDAKPLLVCAYGLVISGLLLAGFRVSQMLEGEVAATQIFSGPWLAVTPGSNPDFGSDPDQQSPLDIRFMTFTSSSKGARVVFGAEPSLIPLEDSTGHRFSPVTPVVSPR